MKRNSGKIWVLRLKVSKVSFAWFAEALSDTPYQSFAMDLSGVP